MTLLLLGLTENNYEHVRGENFCLDYEICNLFDFFLLHHHFYKIYYLS